MPAFKRKAANGDLAISPPPPKKQVRNFDDRSLYRDSKIEIENGIVLREFYPPELTDKRANMYAAGELERPIETLAKAIKETQSARDKIPVKDAVVHWYKNDLRTRDNKGLSLAAELAKSKGVPLVCLYICSPQDWEAHITAAVRVDFALRNLEVLKKSLAELDVPLYVETVEKRRNVPGRIVELCEEWGANHVFCNAEYEVDELRREAKLTRECLAKGISFNVVHDTCVVEPGKLTSGKGGQISIYSPWHRKWCAYLNAYPEDLKEYPGPEKNPPSARQKYEKLFSSTIPEAPENKKLSPEEQTRFHSMWPAGELEAQDRLDKFIKQRILKYHETRNLPAGNGTSTLSAHLSAGTIAARTVVREALAAAPRKILTDDRKQGHSMWIGEVAWRDFYKHVLCHWPYICMNKPFKAEYSNIEWEYDDEKFQRWCEGMTGFPLVDAAMRQAKQSAYMHNRCRMVVASFLAKDLLIDWRMGEKWFMEHLVDGDFASNNGGWGFSASCGVGTSCSLPSFPPLLVLGTSFEPY